jgi:hypothetical protein
MTKQACSQQLILERFRCVDRHSSPTVRITGPKGECDETEIWEKQPWSRPVEAQRNFDDVIRSKYTTASNASRGTTGCGSSLPSMKGQV